MKNKKLGRPKMIQTHLDYSRKKEEERGWEFVSASISVLGVLIIINQEKWVWFFQIEPQFNALTFFSTLRENPIKLT